MSYVRDIIESICENSVPQDEVVWEQRPKELRWSWINKRTRQVWYAQLSKLRRSGLNRIDPDCAIMLEFIYGKKTAFEAKQYLDKLDNLQAFW